MRTIRSGLAVFTILIGIQAPVARAQPVAGAIEDLQIDLWPEYDQPDVLVMYRIRLRPGRSLDLPVALPIPADAGEPHAVAWRDASGALYVSEFTRTVQGDTATISMRMGSREGQLEFYDELEVDGDRRRYRFEWPGGAPLGSLSFLVQRPAGARNLEVDPPPTREQVGQDGLSYALVELGRQDALSMPSIEVRYEKDTETLSAERRPAPAATSPPPSADAPAGEETLPSWAFALGGGLVALAGGWLVWSLRGLGGAEPGVFCHRCGSRAQRSHRFCSACGTELVRRK